MNWTTEMNIFNTLLNVTEANTDWPLNDTSTMFGSLNENDTFSILALPLSSGRHGKQNSHSFAPHPEHFSPVLLSNEWRPLSRLVFLSIMSLIGTAGNIFMISSVMVEEQLKKAGEHFSLHLIPSHFFTS